MVEFSNSSWGRRAVPYVLAIGACAASGVAQRSLQLALGGRPLSLLPIAIVLAAWFGGVGPGLFATAVAAVTAAVLLPAVHAADLPGLALLALVGVLVSLAMRALHRSLTEERRGRSEAERAL